MSRATRLHHHLIQSTLPAQKPPPPKPRQSPHNAPTAPHPAQNQQTPPHPREAAAPANHHYAHQSESTTSAAAQAYVERYAPAPARPAARQTQAASPRPHPPALATAHSTNAAQQDQTANPHPPHQNTPAPPRPAQYSHDRTTHSATLSQVRDADHPAWNPNNRARNSAAHHRAAPRARTADALHARHPDASRQTSAARRYAYPARLANGHANLHRHLAAIENRCASQRRRPSDGSAFFCVERNDAFHLRDARRLRWQVTPIAIAGSSSTGRCLVRRL